MDTLFNSHKGSWSLTLLNFFLVTLAQLVKVYVGQAVCHRFELHLGQVELQSGSCKVQAYFALLLVQTIGNLS